MGRVDEVGVGSKYGFTLPDNALPCLGALNEFLLDVVVVGRNGREKESQNTENRDYPECTLTVLVH